MGTGNKLDPTRLEIEDIYRTSVCPLAKVMRRELKKRQVDSLKVLYSKEKPLVPQLDLLPKEEREGIHRTIPGSIAFVPAAAGLIIAGEVVKDLVGKEVTVNQ